MSRPTKVNQVAMVEMRVRGWSVAFENRAFL